MPKRSLDRCMTAARQADPPAVPLIGHATRSKLTIPPVTERCAMALEPTGVPGTRGGRW